MGLLGCVGAPGDSGLGSTDTPPGSHQGSQSGSESAGECVEVSRVALSDWSATPDGFSQPPSVALEALAGPWAGALDDGQGGLPFAGAIHPWGVDAVALEDLESGQSCAGRYAIEVSLSLSLGPPLRAWGGGEALAWEDGDGDIEVSLGEVQGSPAEGPLTLSGWFGGGEISAVLLDGAGASLGELWAQRP